MRAFLETKKLPLRWIGWFFFSNACLFWLIGIHYLSWITPNHFSALSLYNEILVWIFIVLTLIGHFALLAFLPALFIFPFVLDNV